MSCTVVVFVSCTVVVPVSCTVVVPAALFDCTIFTTIYEAITGRNNKDVVGIVDNHEDRINSLEKDIGAINHSLMAIQNMIDETKSKTHLIITLQVYANTALLNLVALRTAINGFHSLLNGHIIPDLVPFHKMSELYYNLKTRAWQKGFNLVSKHPTDFYNLHVSYVTYKNVSSGDLELVVYLKPKIYRTGDVVTLKRMVFLPITYQGVNKVFNLEDNKDVFIAVNKENTLTQIVHDIKDCESSDHFYSCPMTGIHYKDNTKCPLAIANREQNLAEVCSFSVRTTASPSFSRQLNENNFILFTGNEIDRITIKCKAEGREETKNDISLKHNTPYSVEIPVNCIGDTEKYYLTAVTQLSGEAYEALSISFLMDRQGGNISEAFSQFTKEEIREGLNTLDTDLATKYSKDHFENKLKLKRIKERETLKESIVLSVVLSILGLVVLCVSILLYKTGLVKCEKCKKPNKKSFHSLHTSDFEHVNLGSLGVSDIELCPRTSGESPNASQPASFSSNKSTQPT